MAQPKYGDIGKSANDLLNKGYGIGTFKIKVKSNGTNNKQYEYKTSANHDFKSEVLDYNVKFKYNLQKYQMVLTEKWTPNNTLTTGLELFDYFIKGLTIHLESNYNFLNNNRNASIKTDYTTPSYRFQNKINLLDSPILNSTFVVGNKDAVAGLQIATDLQKNQIKSYNVAASKIHPNYELNFFIKNDSNYGGSFLYKAGSNLDLGGEISIKQNEGETSYTIASKYCVSDDMIVKAKINNESLLSIGVKHKMTPFLSLTGATQFPLYSIPDKSLKIGFGVEYSS